MEGEGEKAAAAAKQWPERNERGRRDLEGEL